MGIGGLVVFNDGNHNGELDLIEIDATESVDTVLGAQRFENLEAILFREGDATDLVELLDMAGCPDSPQGFSLIRVQGGFEMALGCDTSVRRRLSRSPLTTPRRCASGSARASRCRFPRLRVPPTRRRLRTPSLSAARTG